MTAVEVRNLSKVYKLYQSPSQRLKEIILRRPLHTEFAALNNITFSVKKGGTFGIIGENGAGKSTLLKILARTLKPTFGDVTTHGRTAALLELGAGFNPEFTGEENIYLNAYLMGLSKAEIDEKRDEIINFSELGDFIKRPIKTYSSGMYVRLAFSIATSVDPDILIIDEALSVGDEYFQKKCINRMMKFRDIGKTILFCSHSMYHIQELCNNTMWLHKGEIKGIGDTGKTITDYQNYERDKSAVLKEKTAEMLRPVEPDLSKPVRIYDLKVLDRHNTEADMLKTFDPAVISFRIQCSKEDIKGHIGFTITRNDEVMVFGTVTVFEGLPPTDFKDGQEIQVVIPSLPLLAGMYHFMVIVADEHAMHPHDIQKTRNLQVMPGRREFGINYLQHEWKLE
jgi:ABC-type polysaccharide/polyol phosphate transport system ATPase subunit